MTNLNRILGALSASSLALCFTGCAAQSLPPASSQVVAAPDYAGHGLKLAPGHLEFPAAGAKPRKTMVSEHGRITYNACTGIAEIVRIGSHGTWNIFKVTPKAEGHCWVQMHGRDGFHNGTLMVRVK